MSSISLYMVLSVVACILSSVTSRALWSSRLENGVMEQLPDESQRWNGAIHWLCIQRESVS
jgi:hypothetical protein